MKILVPFVGIAALACFVGCGKGKDGDAGKSAGDKAEAAAQASKEFVDAPIVGKMRRIPGRDYLIGCTEVTQAQWQKVMPYNLSRTKGPNIPVQDVSWEDCQKFIDKLNNKKEVQKAKLFFRLPTKEEWLYACRAGGSKEWGLRENGESGPGDVMGWNRDNSGGEAHPVAKKEPNAWGIYDMHGNVMEWCADRDGLSQSGSKWVEKRVLIGGAFSFPVENSAAEGWVTTYPQDKSPGASCGFRVAATLSE